MSFTSSAALCVGPAEATQRDQALAVLYGRLPRRERDRQIAELLAAARRGEFSLDDLLVARRDEKIVGAVLAIRRDGRMAFLWPPESLSTAGADEIAAGLLNGLTARLDAARVLFAQCLCDPDNPAQSAQLSAAGFPWLTEMLLLTRKIPGGSGAPETRAPARLPTEWAPEGYRTEVHGRFARLLAETCRETLDCPALAGLRSGEEMLAAHKQASARDERLWMLWRSEGVDAGILLAAEHRERNVREILYVGVAPQFRRRGLARHMLQTVLDQAAADERAAVDVAVDAGNRYALPLYRDLNFSERSRLAVHLRVRPEAAFSQAESSAAGEKRQAPAEADE